MYLSRRMSVCIVNNIPVVPCLYDDTAVAVSGKVGPFKFQFIKQVG